MGKDYYQTLGLERGASEAEISKAYVEFIFILLMWFIDTRLLL